MADKQGGPYERSGNYRKDYLNKHKGVCGVYCCAYCGRLVPKSKMEVDHIYPIGQVKDTTKGKAFVALNTFWRGSKESNKGVNGTWNTVSSCHDCNHKKSDKGGLWVYRGYIGRIVFPIINIILYGNILWGALMIIFNDNSQKFITSLVTLLVVRIVGRLLTILAK